MIKTKTETKSKTECRYSGGDVDSTSLCPNAQWDIYSILRSNGASRAAYKFLYDFMLIILYAHPFKRQTCIAKQRKVCARLSYSHLRLSARIYMWPSITRAIQTHTHYTLWIYSLIRIQNMYSGTGEKLSKLWFSPSLVEQIENKIFSSLGIFLLDFKSKSTDVRQTTKCSVRNIYKTAAIPLHVILV